jgi:signal transduction histidine kinase/CheY-like chemotaxis protein
MRSELPPETIRLPGRLGRSFSLLLLFLVLAGTGYFAVLIFTSLLHPFRFPTPYAVPIFDSPFVLAGLAVGYLGLERHRLLQDFRSASLGMMLWLAAILALAHVGAQPDYPGTPGVNPGVAPYFFLLSYLAGFASIGLATHFGHRQLPLRDRERLWIALGLFVLSSLIIIAVVQIRPLLPSLVMKPGRLTPFALWVAGVSEGCVGVWALWGAVKKCFGKDRDWFSGFLLLAGIIWMVGLVGFLLFPYRYAVSWYLAGLARPIGVGAIFVGLVREQVWLYREARARQRDLESLHAAGQALVTSLDPQRIVDTIAAKAVEVSGAQSAILYRLDTQAQLLRVVSHAGVTQEFASGLELPIGVGVAGLAVATRQPAWTSDLQIDAGVQLPPEVRERVRREGLTAFLSIPLLIESGEVFGALSVAYRDAREFADTDLQLLSAFGTQAAVAIENARAFDRLARLYAELQTNLHRLQETQAQLIQADKLTALGTLLSGMAHELNNPLNSILLSAQLLKQKHDLEDPLLRRVDLIEKESQRAARIIRDLLVFARRKPPERRQVDVNEAVQAALALHAPEFPIHNIRQVTELEPSLPRIWADPTQLQQVFLNLFTNATHAMKTAHAQGTLTVRSFRQDSGICVTVEDDGPGIPPQHLGRIFDPFFTTKGPGAGTGLGLSLSLGIIESHGGRMTAENLPHGGARFIVELPVGAGVEPLEIPQLEVPATSGRPARVLLVDDEANLRQVLAEIVSALGHQAESAATGREAIACLERQRYDVVALDLRLPDISGEEVWRWILARDPAQASRVVFLTGDTMSKEAQEFLQEAGRPLLTKPISIEQISRVINAILTSA